MDYKELCFQVQNIAHNTGNFIRGEQKKISEKNIEIKSVASLVTYVDKTAEKQIVDALKELLPEAGFVAEVESLRARKDLNLAKPALRAVGYRQVWQYLDGEFGLSTLREKSVAATRQLAKRQLTWLRSTDGVIEFDCLLDDLPERVHEAINAQFSGNT